MTLVSKEDFLAKDDANYIEIEVPSWGRIRVRSLSGAGRDRYLQDILQWEDGVATPKTEDSEALLLALTLVDEDGKLWFDNVEEGVNIVYLATPNKIWNENEVVRLQCIRMELGEVDASGRRRPVPIKGSEFITSCDSVIVATGQMLKVLGSFKVATGRGGVIKTWDNSSTSREGVFAGGDAVTGPASVIEAIASGRQGTITIDKYLGGRGIIDEELAPVEEPKAWLGCEENFARLHRVEIPCMHAEQRLSGFDEIEKGYDEKTAHEESLRCLQCDSRLKISSAKLPPKRCSMKGGW